MNTQHGARTGPAPQVAGIRTRMKERAQRRANEHACYANAAAGRGNAELCERQKAQALEWLTIAMVIELAPDDVVQRAAASMAHLGGAL